MDSYLYKDNTVKVYPMHKTARVNQFQAKFRRFMEACFEKRVLLKYILWKYILWKRFVEAYQSICMG